MKSFKDIQNNVDEAAGWINKAASSTSASKEDPTSSLSDAAKKAIEQTKKDAGDAWDEVSDKYTKVISLIDKGIQDLKNVYSEFSKSLGAPLEDIEGKIAGFAMSVLEANRNISKTMQSWLDDTSDNGAQAMSNFSLFCVGVMSASKASLKPQDITDAITAMANDGQ